MEQVLYSYLYAGKGIDLDDWSEKLDSGKKVLCFLNDKDMKCLEDTEWKNKNHSYFKTFCNPKDIELSIIDGKMSEKDKQLLFDLSKDADTFNIEQYLVEHASKESNLCVEAGAGTGKTTVMIDRIMYLFHTDPSFSFAKVAMITFTNKATDNMRHRLLKELNVRYALTHELKYLKGLEEVSQVSISTIHAFFRRLIIELGPLMGYGNNLKMRSYALEKREILRDLLENAYGQSTSSVIEKFGLSMYEIEGLASEYWNKMENNGLTDLEINELDWGTNADHTAGKIQNQLIKIFSQVDKVYNEHKLRNNAISMKDIIHALGALVQLEEANEYITSSFDYIFCDEFQDTDMVQIKTIAFLTQIYNCSLFVVGDIKQSIYRFRGATDAAFQRLISRSTEIQFEPASLVKNYRTSRDIMTRLDVIFKRWNQAGYIRYEEKDELSPQNHEPGVYKQIPVTKKNRKDIVMKQIKDIMNEDGSAIITVLTRTNKELQEVRAWCEEEKDIVHQIKERGSFFNSPPVLDMCAMLEGLLYDSIPMYVWELLNTPYIEKKHEISINELKELEGSQYKVWDYLYSSFDEKKWRRYQKDIKERPVLSVIREIVDECDPLSGYISDRIAELKRDGLDNDKITTQVTLDARSYNANLEKLLQILQDRFSSDFSSLYDICSYLRLRIETDNDEEQALIERKTDQGYVEGFTVHSAKGLEFDHVLIPFMVFPFVSAFRSEILFSDDNKRVGWIFRKGDKEISSLNYRQMKGSENMELLRDETRLLYVAMTRAIKSLYCFPTRSWGNDGVNNWSGLLIKEEDNA